MLREDVTTMEEERAVEDLKKYGEKRNCCPNASKMQKRHCHQALMIKEEINRCDRRHYRSSKKDLCWHLEKKIKEMILSHMEWKENRMTNILNNILKSRGERMVADLHEIMFSKVSELDAHTIKYNDDGARIISERKLNE